MNIPKAIEIKEIYYKSGVILNYSDYRLADRISIEALEFLSQWERDHNGEKLVILPGETED